MSPLMVIFDFNSEFCYGLDSAFPSGRMLLYMAAFYKSDEAVAA